LFFDPFLETTNKASRTIAARIVIKVREDDFLLAAAFFAGAATADLTGVGSVEILLVAELRVGTAGTLYEAATLFTELFTLRFADDFLVADFLAEDFFTAFLTVRFEVAFFATFLTGRFADFFAAFFAATNNS
jgi:hypothetical protein